MKSLDHAYELILSGSDQRERVLTNLESAQHEAKILEARMQPVKIGRFGGKDIIDPGEEE